MSPASLGTVTYLFQTIRPGANKAQTPKAVRIVKPHSNFGLSGA